MGRCGSRGAFTSSRSGKEVGVGKGRLGRWKVREHEEARTRRVTSVQRSCALFFIPTLLKLYTLRVIEDPKKLLFIWFIGTDICYPGN